MYHLRIRIPLLNRGDKAWFHHVPIKNIFAERRKLSTEKELLCIWNECKRELGFVSIWMIIACLLSFHFAALPCCHSAAPQGSK